MEETVKQVIDKILAEHGTFYKAHKHTGISKTVYSRLVHKPTLENLQRIAKAHNIPITLEIKIG